MAEEIWNSFARLNAGERFKAQSAEMGSWVTEAVVEAAQIVAGLQVLDVACGSGEPSISIAARLKELGGQASGKVTGHVTGMDMASAPLEVARERARVRGLDNVEFVQVDVHAMPFAGGCFDRVTSRLGVMFFSDLATALAEMHRVLKPGGVVALLTWGPMEQPYFESTIGTVRRVHPELEVPETARAMFKFGEAGTMRRALTEAGFGSVQEQLQGLRWDWHGSPEQMWEYFRGVTVPFHSLMEKVAGDAAVEQAVLAALGERFDGEWVRFEAQMVVATAVR
jgi:ubiquinone/menaquinone biosynthesis C-methylase UbiE